MDITHPYCIPTAYTDCTALHFVHYRSSPIGITLFESCIREPVHLNDHALLHSDTNTHTDGGVEDGVQSEDNNDNDESKNEYEIDNKMKSPGTSPLVSEA